MPYQSIGKFLTQQGISRHDDFKRPVTFYDRVRFVGADSSVEIFGGIITGDIRLSSDFVSGNWDGADPLSIPDTTATAGYAFDYSEGSAQFEGDLYVEGTLFTTSDPTAGGLHIRLAQATIGERISWYDDSDEVAFIESDSAGDLYITNFDNHMRFTVEGNTNFYFQQEGVGGDAPQLLGSSGAADSPTYSFISDSDSGLYRSATNQVTVTTGGSARMSWKADGTVTSGSGTDGSFHMTNAAGTISLPTYAFASDLDTGMYRAASNNLQLVAGGAQMLGMTSTSFAAPVVYSQTGGAANVSVASNGKLTRVTSALKYKHDVVEAYDIGDIDLVPVSYRENSTGVVRLGLIADWLGEQDSRLGTYSDKGIEDYDTRGVLAILAAKVNRLTELVESGILDTNTGERT